MKVLIVWAVGNLAWMVLVYCVTLAYSRFRKRPTSTLLSVLGTLLATASAMIAVRWWTPLMIHAPQGTFWYYVGVALLATAGPGLCGLVILVVLSACDKDLTEMGWFNQLALPFYVSFYLFGGLVTLGGLIGFLASLRAE